MSRYDEDLYDNPFFVSLEKQQETLFDKSTANSWIICIPKFTVVNQKALSLQDFQDHILVTAPDSNDTFKSVSNNSVTIQDGHIDLGAGYVQQKQVEILFEETFYNVHDNSYRVLCVDDFLNKETQVTEAPGESAIAVSKHPVAYGDCIQILFGNLGNVKTKDNLDKILRHFCSTYQKFEGESMPSLVDLVSTQVTTAMQIVLKDTNIKQSVKIHDQYMVNLKAAVEMYMMNAVHKHLFSTITACVKTADALVNKMTRNLVDIRLHHLGVRPEFENNLPAAKKEIAKLNQYSTPLGRLLCVKRVVTALAKATGGEQGNEGLVMTTDDFLPLLIYLIIKSQIPNWTANLMYMKHFQQAENGEFSFYLATTEAALDYIKGGNLKIDHSKSPIKPSKPVQSGESAVYTRQASGGMSSTKDKFFQYVQCGDELAVCMMLKRTSPRDDDDTLSQLCHPLCDCDTCRDIHTRNKHNHGAISILARDDMGRTALHIAALYGQAGLIDILAKNGALADASDYLGFTPLHMACQKGYQNIILLLVHFGADISAVENEGNTPLHLCAKNGHEDCVKAILFLDILKNRLDVNSQNDIGDTPLHLAAKWGYEGIVKFLLESEADPRIRNRKRQTPLNFAQNPAIKRELQSAFIDPQPIIVRHNTAPSTSSIKPNTSRLSKCKPNLPATLPGVDNQSKTPDGFEVVDVKSPSRPSIQLIDNSSSEMMSPTTPAVASLDQADTRQKERLFAAIKNKDIQLVKFYLGWIESGEYDDDDSPSKSPPGDTLCHPLCQCHKCKPIQKNTYGSSLHVNCQNRKGFAPLHIAVIENNMEAFNLFLKKGANVNVKTIRYITPLHQACYYANMKMVEELVQCGANINCVDQHGEIPLHLACSKQNRNIVLHLIQNGSEVNISNVNGNTPLHHAAVQSSMDTVKLLLDNGADPDIVNNNKQTPASLSKHQDIIEVLHEVRQKACFSQLEAKSKLDSKTERILKLKQMMSTLDDKSLQTLQGIGTDVATFDKGNSLKRSKTFDHSTPSLDSPNLKLSLSIKNFNRERNLKHSETSDRSSTGLRQLKHSLSIQQFDQGTLKHVDVVDKSSPIHFYTLSRSLSSYGDYTDGPKSVDEDLLDGKEKHVDELATEDASNNTRENPPASQASNAENEINVKNDNPHQMDISKDNYGSICLEKSAKDTDKQRESSHDTQNVLEHTEQDNADWDIVEKAEVLMDNKTVQDPIATLDNDVNNSSQCSIDIDDAKDRNILDTDTASKLESDKLESDQLNTNTTVLDKETVAALETSEFKPNTNTELNINISYKGQEVVSVMPSEGTDKHNVE